MKNKSWTAPDFGADVQLLIDTDNSVKISIPGEWFSAVDLRAFAKKLKRLANKIDIPEVKE